MDFKIQYLCNTSPLRQEGLMHKRPLASNQCAWFEFNFPQELSFWNKNVAFDICVVFIDEHFKIKNIEILKAHQERPVYSSGPCLYVAEILAENFEKILFFKNAEKKDNIVCFYNPKHVNKFSENTSFQKIANTVYRTVR